MSDIVRSQRERIRRVIQNRNFAGTKSRFDTSDVIQETELQIWLSSRNRESSEPTIAQALLATMARGNLAKKQRMHRAAKRDASREQPITDCVKPDARDPLDQVALSEQVDRMLRAMNLLNEEERLILFRRYFCHSTFLEIADELEMTRQKVETRLERSLRNLKQLMSNGGDS